MAEPVARGVVLLYEQERFELVETHVTGPAFGFGGLVTGGFVTGGGEVVGDTIGGAVVGGAGTVVGTAMAIVVGVVTGDDRA